MSSYTLQSTALNKNHVFILQKSELEKRLDPFYYIPEISELEKKVLAKNPKKLRDFVKKIASGATPKRDEEEKYYSDNENGIPFLRVQNLSPTGILEFDDCKYINEETHNGMLKRSQVSEGDLLVKITGVGRMAVASVAPENFEGNINQHVCVIKTGSKELSQIIAAFLNSDIGEKLASRRSTGGTRPALDYPALLSIPIIDDSRILEISKKVAEQKKLHEAEAEKLLNSIDDYLLGELGIALLEKDNSLHSRIFQAQFSEISGKRIDPYYNHVHFRTIFERMKKGNYPIRTINDCVMNYSKGVEVGSAEYTSEGIPFLRVSDINYFEINTKDTDKKISEELFLTLKENYNPQIGEILYTKDGSVGFCTIVEKQEEYIISGAILRITPKNTINKHYLQYILSTKLYKLLADKVSIGAVIKHITLEDWFKLPIPLPPLEKQNEIAEHIKNIRDKAQTLKDEVKTDLENARREIEKIIFEN
jgi:restriction endonuclease S subunit